MNTGYEDNEKLRPALDKQAEAFDQDRIGKAFDLDRIGYLLLFDLSFSTWKNIFCHRANQDYKHKGFAWEKFLWKLLLFSFLNSYDLHFLQVLYTCRVSEIMLKMGYSKIEIHRALSELAFNEVYATYHLLGTKPTKAVSY